MRADRTGHREGTAGIVVALARDAQLGDDAKQPLRAIEGQLAAYRKYAILALDLATDDVNMGLAALQTADSNFQELRRALDALVDIEKKLAQTRYEEAAATSRNASILAGVVFFLAIVGSGLMGAFVTRSVTGQMGGEPEYAVQVARRGADGDLAPPVATAAPDRPRGRSAIRKSVQRLAHGVGAGRAPPAPPAGA